MIDLPTTKVWAVNAPLCALAIRRENECAFPRADEYPYRAHTRSAECASILEWQLGGIKAKPANPQGASGLRESGKRDSNPRPQPWQDCRRPGPYIASPTVAYRAP